MLFIHLTEMAAAKLCPTCGKTMAANHYWYKGAWKCKGASKQQAQNPTIAAAKAEPEDATEQPTDASNFTQPEDQSQQITPVPAEPDTATGPIHVFALSFVVDVIEDAMPVLEKELTKINKIAARVGADPVELKQLGVVFKDAESPGKTTKFKQKFITVELIGAAPRIQSADGKFWEFIGVISPSASGKAVLNLVPGTEDTDGVRKLASSNPYYCDYCRKVRQRNETFIVTDGTAYRQVGRNCLKDFIGSADPAALLSFFGFFQNAADFKSHMLNMAMRGANKGAGYEKMYLKPRDILATTMAAIDVVGHYVPAKTETGVSTAQRVREAMWGSVYHDGIAEKISDKMDDQQYKTEADDIINWFNSLPQAEIDANTYYQNVKTMIDDDAVETRFLAYVVGLYAAWKRAQPKPAATATPQLTKDWPQAWGNGPQPVTKEHAVVKFVKDVNGQYGTSQLILLMLDNGQGVSWFYSGRNTVEKDDEFELTGEFHKDSYHNPPTVKFVPDRKWLRSAFQ